MELYKEGCVFNQSGWYRGLSRPIRLFGAGFFILIEGGRMMSEQIMQIAQRIKGMREMLDLPIEEAAKAVGMEPAQYAEYEEGEHDFAFSFLFGLANRFGVDITNLITGDTPKLHLYSLVKKGEGLKIDRRKDYKYQHLAFYFKDKIAEPFLVTVEYDKNLKEVHPNSHEGQEFNYVLKGSMAVTIEDKVLELSEGDALYYDAKHKHAMKALGGDCQFLAIIMK
jgi:transcriptional regulator with XRE-family HTH domain